MADVVLLLSGPNLSLLGDRQPHIYGYATLQDHVERARTAAVAHGLELEHFQSDSEAELVKAVHGARKRAAGIVANVGALTHYSWSLHDAFAAFEGPVVEIHLSNPDAREPFRHTSVLSPVVSGSIAGFGAFGYTLSVDAIAELLKPS